MSTTSWYYRVGKEKFGPVAPQDLKTLVATGKIGKDDRVWREGLAAWVPAHRVMDLFPAESDIRPAEVLRDERAETKARAVNAPKKVEVPSPEIKKHPETRKAEVDSEEDLEGIDLEIFPENDEPFLEFDDDPFVESEPADTRPARRKRETSPGTRNEKEKRRRRVKNAAGFWRRFAARFIDGAILLAVGAVLQFGIVFVAMMFVAEGQISPRTRPSDYLGPNFAMILYGLHISILWLYDALLTSSSSQATLGKSFLDMKVTDLDGDPVSFSRASARYFARDSSLIIGSSASILLGYSGMWGICVLIYLAGHLTQLFTPRRQTLHDLVAGALVVKK